MSTSCSELAPLIAARRLGILEDSDLSEIEAHLASCASCAALASDVELALSGAALAPERAPDGIRSKLAARIAEDRKTAASPVTILLSCTYCHDVLSRENAVFCASCLAPCHEDCFLEHGKCSTFGCDETRFVQPRNVSPTAAAPKRARKGRRISIVLAAVCLGGTAAALALRAQYASEERLLAAERIAVLEEEVTRKRVAAVREHELALKDSELAEKTKELKRTQEDFNEFARKSDEDKKRLLAEREAMERRNAIRMADLQEQARLGTGVLEGVVRSHKKPLADTKIHYMVKTQWQDEGNGKGHWGRTSGSSFTTDLDGRYRIADLTACESALDFWNGDDLGLRKGACLSGVMIEAGKTRETDIDLGPGTFVSGDLVLPQGSDPNKLELTVMGYDKKACDLGGVLFGGLSRDGGKAVGDAYCIQLFGAPFGKHSIAAKLPGYVTAFGEITLEGEGMVSIKGPALEVGRGCTLVGRFVDRKEKPSKGARFTLELVDRGFTEGFETEEDGSFRLKGVPVAAKVRIWANGKKAAELLSTGDEALGSLLWPE